ncbi:hypothetical protein BG006_006888 [Podila minutissima]|uniref:Uncharacterized protein n=1 Tax=Podila minutissima TaxID=64525 RepID=A0A9P5SRQ0_9FUNG|nr:hypothetical protein BG006_006888 [Podila minutissima]
MSAAYIRTLARMATRTKPSSMLLSRQAPVAAIARQYHAFRPTQIALKGRKHALKDEDDAELEAELLELEREKRELEALERGEAGSSSSESQEESNSRFQELYDTLIAHTTPSTPKHELPRHSSLYHLAKAVSSVEQSQEIPTAVAQWRQSGLPITILVSDKLVRSVCKAGSPETALELLGDREKYALTPGQSTMRRVVRAFVRQVSEEEGTEEGLAKLDGAFKAMALIPYYNLAADDASVYANLVRGSLLYGGEEGLRRASVTMDEFLLIDGEREAPLTKKRAAEVVAAAEKLTAAYEAEGQAEKAEALKKPIAEWKKSL